MKASEQWRVSVPACSLPSYSPLYRRSSASSHSARVHLTGTMMEVSPAPVQTTTLYFSEPSKDDSENKENKESKEIKENIMLYVLIV